VIEFCPGVIYIPNAFTPNNDGVNDFWFIEGENIVEFDLKVYNRWGALIYASKDIETPWLGQWRDGDTYVESDIYSYLITVRYLELDGNLSGYQEVQGHVTVIR
jgi:gliding motility-associated-like protein